MKQCFFSHSRINFLQITLFLFAFLTHCSHAANDPFRVDGRPPQVGFFTSDLGSFDADIVKIDMLKELAGIYGEIEPRQYSILRKAINRDEIAPEQLNEIEPISYLHLFRSRSKISYAVYLLDKKNAVISTLDEPREIWGIDQSVFERIGIDWPNNKSKPIDQIPNSFPARVQLTQPYEESKTVLDLRTVRARIKVSYPRLSRDLDNEIFRVRLPSNFNDQFPAGVLVWISPSSDGRIPKIFEPALDELGFVAVGIDNNGNRREITDRLQNVFDSIETVGSRYRIDRKRIYLTGMSGGGRCSGILQIAFPELFAGAIPIVGLDTYHNAPTGEPGKFWPARIGRPAGKWMNLLKERRIAAITGSADFNQPEMSIRQDLLKADGVEMRLDIIEGMAHTMPTTDQFTDAFKWVDIPRRDSMVESFKKAKSLKESYLEMFDDFDSSNPAQRKMLIEIIELAPWTEPALWAADILGYEL
ncbi:MAG: hypothetical protein P1U42_02275 [Phycisphaerales bacterium]|nr:hypothetical protein [Phycisphaerales bacterium]